jgi:hypothetical protein
VLRLAVPGAALALADALPLFDSLDLRAIEEVPYKLTPARRGRGLAARVRLDAGCDILPEREPLLLDALETLIAGEIEADGFNRLVAARRARLARGWLIRSMYRWLKQVGFPFAQESVAAALAATPEAARILADLFHKRFDPAVTDRDEAALDRGLDGDAGPGRRPRHRPHPAAHAQAARRDAADQLLPEEGLSSPSSWTARSPATCRCRAPGARSSCTTPPWKAATCAPARSRAAASAGPTGARISARRSWA